MTYSQGLPAFVLGDLPGMTLVAGPLHYSCLVQSKERTVSDWSTHHSQEAQGCNQTTPPPPPQPIDPPYPYPY